jgi:hypothetical protein
MRKVLGLILLVFPVFAASLFAQRTAIFPRLATGAGWTSDFFFNNQGRSPVQDIAITFYAYNDVGARVSLETNLGIGSSFTFDLNGGQTQVVRITSGSEFRQGYVLVEYPTFYDAIRGSQVFRYEADGVVTTEVGLPQQEQGDHFSFPVEIDPDPAKRIYPAIALSNPMSDGQTLVVNLIRSDGIVQDTVAVTMQSGQHRAGYLDQDWLFPGLNNAAFTGSVSISSPFGIGVMTLRQDKNAFGGIATDGGPVIGPFALTGASVAEDEPNDEVEDAQPITGSTIVTGSIGVEYDADVFYFYGIKDQIVTIFCDTQGTDSPLDSVLGVYDDDVDLTQIAFNDQNGLAPGLYPQNDSFIQMVIPASGIYYVMIWDFWDGGDVDFTYTLHFNLP